MPVDSNGDWTPKLIDIEVEFTKFVESYNGGKRLVEILGQIPAGYLNADYYLAQDDVIVELKCLSVDAGDAETQARRLHASALHLGYNGVDLFRWTMHGTPVPAAVSRNAQTKKMRSVIEILKKANKQIRATKLLLNKPDARGLIALANDNNFGLSPREAMVAQIKAFQQMTDIHTDCIVYFTPNVFHDMGDGIAHEFWTPIYNVGSEQFGDFVNAFGSAWGDYKDQNFEKALVRTKGVDAYKEMVDAKVITQFRRRLR